MKFSKLEKQTIVKIAKDHLLKLKLEKANVFTHKEDGWRIHKLGKTIFCEFWDGADELLEQYQSKTILGLKRNLISKMWSQI